MNPLQRKSQITNKSMLQVVCGVIVNSVGEYLLCQRPEWKSQAGLWEFPGGKIEEGETAQQALVRELREELGCDVTVGKALSSVVHHYEEFAIELVPFFCYVIGGEPMTLEHQSIEWVRLEVLCDYVLAPADEPIVEELRSI
ncbi:MAG: 8-oxo-dGTP diphosphatase MutT [Rubritalea sp.]